MAMEAKRNANRDVKEMDHALSESRVKNDLVKIRLKKLQNTPLLYHRKELLQLLSEEKALGGESLNTGRCECVEGTISVLQRQLREKSTPNMTF